MAAANTPRVWGLAAKEVWRRVRRRLRAGPVYRWRYTGRTPERVLIAPPDLRLADPQIAEDFYFGRFPLAGRMVESQGGSPFEIDKAPAAWKASLHGFRWLRHMRAAGTDLACANARALVSDWIDLHGSRIEGLAWTPGVTAMRIMSWLQHSTTVLQGAEYPFYRSYLRSLALQVRYLRSVATEMPDGEDKLRARIALAFSALSLPASPATVAKATRNLAAELDAQILPDGGHVSRNPRAVMELLADLLPLRQTYASQAETPPDALIRAIDRMLPALRFFRHRDGSLARFNGMGATVPDRIAAILRHDDTAGQPLLHAPHSGYERLALGETTVIADAGMPGTGDYSREMHAGCLSFELSSTRRCIIVNAGMDPYGPEDFRPLARATAAHSTAALNDTSSCRFTLSPRLQSLLGTPVVTGPRHVRSRRTDDRDVQGFVASHDGYAAPFGIVHERELTLSAGGRRLDGVDRFFRPGGAPPRPNGRDNVAIRFHLHPDVELFHAEGGALVLRTRDGEDWIFDAPGIEPRIEESIFFAGLGGPRRNLQIVLGFGAAARPEVGWSLERAALPDGA